MQKAIITTIVLILCGFMFGWLFPVEGPFDSNYDEYITIHTSPSKPAPVLKQVITYDDIDPTTWLEVVVEDKN